MQWGLAKARRPDVPPPRQSGPLQQLRSYRLADPHPRGDGERHLQLEEGGASWNAPSPSVLDLDLDELRQQSERFLPAQIASLGRNDFGHSFLHDVQLRADGHLLQGDRHPHLSWQVRVIELVGVANAFVWRQ